MRKRHPTFQIMNRKRIIILLAYIVLLSTVGYGQFWLRRSSAPQIFGEAVLSVNTSEKVAALTFDDGPNPESTEEILNILAKYEAKATFFIVGESAQKHSGLIVKIYENGN